MIRIILVSLSLAILSIPKGYSQNIIQVFSPIIRGAVPIGHIGFQSDGKVITGSANLKIAAGIPVNGVVRLNPDGTLDQNFGIESSFEGGLICDLVVQSDDKIVVGGQNILKDISSSPIARFNADGSVDTTFNSAIQTDAIVEIVPVADNKFLIASFPSSNQFSSLARINSDGSLDETFDSGLAFDTGFQIDIFDIAVNADGKIIIVGTFTTFNGQAVNKIVCLNEDGSVDESFDVGTGPSLENNGFSYIQSVSLQSDGKIILAGSFDKFDGSDTNNIIRLLEDGSVDSDFIIAEAIFNAFGSFSIKEVEVLSNDDIILASHADLIKLHSDGSYDPTFFSGEFNNELIVGFAGSVEVVQSPDGLIYFGGRYSRYNNAFRVGLLSLDASGVVTEFDPQLGGIPDLRAIEVQEDGKILVGGIFLGVEDIVVNNIARFNPDGSLDEDFVSNLGSGPQGNVRDIYVNESGEIYVGGSFNWFSDSYHPGIVKLLVDGTMDENFDSNIYVPFVGPGVEKILPQENDLILGGSFQSNLIDQFVRIDGATGIIDASFNADNLFDLDISSGERMEIVGLDLQSDGKILVYGRNVNSPEGGFIYRYSKDGVKDETFESADISEINITSASVLGGDEILLAGFFSGSWGPNDLLPIFRLDNDGKLIDKFSLTSHQAPIEVMLPVSDSEIILGGSFNRINQVNVNALAKISLVEPYEDFDAGFNDFTLIRAIEQVNQSEILVAGIFGSVRNRPGFYSIVQLSLNNDVPIISEIGIDTSLNEDTELLIDVSDLVIDDDNIFPDDFELNVIEGTNYTVAGNKLLPVLNFNGTLNVSVTVNDGNAESDPFEFTLEVLPVNDQPEILKALNVLTTYKNEPVGISLNDFDVFDPDNSYPDDFTLVITEGDNYSIDNNVVTPDTEFSGTLEVGVIVNDGELDSDIFNATIDVSTLTSIIDEQLVELHLYPNPFSDHITIKGLASKGDLKFFLVESSGRRINQKFSVVNESTVTLDLSNIREGIYMIMMETEDKTIVRRIKKN